jgi:hypothetical protein
MTLPLDKKKKSKNFLTKREGMFMLNKVFIAISDSIDRAISSAGLSDQKKVEKKSEKMPKKCQKKEKK